MRVQGTLSVLTNTLQEAALTVQLDLVETISKLIFKNQENQHEFKKIDGYSFFPRLFDKISNFSTKESKLFAEVSPRFRALLTVARTVSVYSLLLLWMVVSHGESEIVMLCNYCCG